jgi:hypothetical protein
MNPLAAEIRTQKVKNALEHSRLLINVEYGTTLAAAGLITFADFFHYPGGELIKRIPERTVTRISLGSGEAFFLKRHLLEKRYLWQQPLLGQGTGEVEGSEGAGEFANYLLFRRRGLATAVPVAMGERQTEGGTVESFVLTLDFSPMLSLEDIIRHTPEQLAGANHAARRRQVLLAAATYARRMHHSGLNHLDFNATHILLEPPAPGQELTPLSVAVFDVQRVATNLITSWRWPIKTLAELNFTLPNALFSADERLLLLTTYLGKERLSLVDRLLWRAIAAKTAKIARHTTKRRTRRKQQAQGQVRGEEQGLRHLLIHDQEGGRVEPVTVTHLLRQVPGSREVYRGEWRARPVIVKAFHGARGESQVAREGQGLQTLQQRGIPAPLPLFRGEDCQGRQTLVLECLEQAVAADKLPAINHPESAGVELRMRLVRALAYQHRQGVWQRDLHLGNFLIQGHTVFAIDPAEMRFVHGQLGTGPSLAQLAEMGALLPGLEVAEFQGLMQEYARGRQWRLSPDTLSRLEKRRQEVIADKLKRRLKKYTRPNTRHQEVRGRYYRLLLDRQSALLCPGADELAAVLREAGKDISRARAGQPFPVTVAGRHLAAYRIQPGGLIKRVLAALFPGHHEAITLWQELYRQQACGVPGPMPVGLLLPCSPWLGLSAFVIIEGDQDQLR